MGAPAPGAPMLPTPVSLDGVVFISAVEKLQSSATPENLPEGCAVARYN